MLNVSHEIQLGQDTYRTGDRTRLLFLETSAALDVPVNAARFAFSHPDRVKVVVDDEVMVKIGYDGFEQVFKGLVSKIDWHIDRVEVEALSATRRLANSSGHHYFDKPFAMEIVRELAKQTDVQVGTTEPGLKFEFYALGTEQSYYRHLRNLADQCGLLLYADPADQLVFARGGLSGTPAVLRYGVDILRAHLGERAAAKTGVTVFGAGPASLGQGPQAAQWFTKKAVQGDAGEQKGARRYYVPAARTTNVANEMAKAIYEADPEIEGKLHIVGNPKIELGQVVQLTLMPVDTQNGTYLAAGVAHRLDPDRGFVSQLTLKSSNLI